MFRPLLPHARTTPGPVRRLDVAAERGAGNLLRLSWRLQAELGSLRVPAPAAPVRADGLWRHTCFEAFIAVAHSPAYCELNFSPSGEWAAWRFTGYRAGMSPLDIAAAPAARWRRAAETLELEVNLPVEDLLGGAAWQALRLALSAVIEGQSGTMSYWALRHPEGEPDFHHPDGFALELPDPGRGAVRDTV